MTVLKTAAEHHQSPATRRDGFWILVAGVCVALGAAGAGKSMPRAATPVPGDPAAIERGRYITHSVAMCVQCHSPRDARGEIIASLEFRGAPIPVTAPFPPNSWALRAPNIRGADAYPKEALVRLLRDGVNRQGVAPDRPMPPFRMSEADARAVAAYLRSLD